MRYVFETQSTIPLEAFHTFGVNVKEKDDAIGRFGTGLKYAVSVILRLGGSIEVWIDGIQHVFYLSKDNFRGKEFNFIRMKKAKGFLANAGWSYTKLPFTTQLGRDWELWQAFRELESNTRDENGESFPLHQEHVVKDSGTTIIISDLDLEDLFSGNTPAFLPIDARVMWENDFVQIIEGSSTCLYYQGIRAYDTRHSSRYTYNFKTDVELTEDRTIKNIWWIEYRLCNILRDNVENPTILKTVLKSGDESYETHDLALYDLKAETTSFSSMVLDLRGSDSLGRAGRLYHESWLATPPPALRTISLTKQEWQEIEQVLRDAGREDLAVKVEVV